MHSTKQPLSFSAVVTHRFHRRIAFLIVALVALSGGSERRERTISVPCASLGRTLKATVVVPSGYDSDSLRYPVIYLLHGYGGNSRTLPRVVPLAAYADTFRIIFVCPDGNANSWYLDSPVKRESRFRTHILEEVIPAVDSLLRTDTLARAIIGTSMGGHGALTLLCEAPHLFDGAGSISGILDLTAFPEEWEVKDLLGSLAKNRDRWMRHSFHYTMERLVGRGKTIIIDCGTEDFAIGVNRRAHERLDSLGIAHHYFERPGGHTFQYVQLVLKEHIGLLARTFADNRLRR